MTRPTRTEATEQLDRLYREYSKNIYRFARMRLPASDAEDIVCEVFVIAWRRLPEIPEYELGWLLKVTRNLISNHLRSQLRRDALTAKVAAAAPTVRSDHAGAIAGQDEFHRALVQLSEQDQEVLRLLVVEDLSVKELAVALGCRANTASVRVKRARERLAGLYAEPSQPTAPDLFPTASTPTLDRSGTQSELSNS